MADTQRTVSALQTLLADNTSGAISPQDLRDMLVSLVPAYGSYYVSTPAATTINTPGTFEKAAGTTTAVANSSRWSMSANNRLLYAGPATVQVHVVAALSVIPQNPNVDLGVAISKRSGGVDSVITSSVIKHRAGTAAVAAALTAHATVELAANDAVEVWVTNYTDTGTATVDNLFVFVQTLPK